MKWVLFPVLLFLEAICFILHIINPVSGWYRFKFFPQWNTYYPQGRYPPPLPTTPPEEGERRREPPGPYLPVTPRE